MFALNDDLSIYATRGDIVFFSVTAADKVTGAPYKFAAGDVVRIKVYGKKDAESVVLQKDFPVTENTETVEIFLTEEDTKIGEVISKPQDYWYEVELNPDENPQTIIGYDEDGAKVFRLFPEGADIPPYEPEIKPEDIPVVDDELDLTSTRPVENRSITRAIVSLKAELHETQEHFAEEISETNSNLSDVAADVSVERERIDNLIKQYSGYGSKHFEHSVDGGVKFNIISNGTSAFLRCYSIGEGDDDGHNPEIPAFGSVEIDRSIIPEEFWPLGDITYYHHNPGDSSYDGEFVVRMSAAQSVLGQPGCSFEIVNETDEAQSFDKIGFCYPLLHPTNEELTDIRVSADGDTYESAGTAVRVQISNAMYGIVKNINYTIAESSTFPIDTHIKKDTRYKVMVNYGENVSAIDIGYTNTDGKDVLLVDNALPGQEYEFTVSSNGTRFRFWTYLKENTETTVTGTLDIIGMTNRAAGTEKRIAEAEASMNGYKARVTKDNFTIAQGFILEQFYKITPGRKFYVSFDSFNYDAIDRVNLYCNHANGNEVFHDALTPIIGELYECYTETENSVLNIYLFPTTTGGVVDFTMSIFDENGTGKRIYFNEKSITDLKETQEKVGIPFYEDHNKKFTITDAWDIEYPTKDDANYVFKADGYTGQNLSELQLYAFNSMQDYTLIQKGVQIGDTVRFTGNSAYKYFRVYAVISKAEEPAGTLSIKLAEYNANSLIARVEALEEATKTTAKAPNVLILGDSYSQMGYWVNQLKSIVGLGEVVNLGVSSATLKDKYTDRTKYPYNNKPVSNDTRGGNVNTFGSQVEKLKRLMLGENLDSGETKVFADSAPDIILIEGGTNDAVDASTDGYLSQIYTVENAYIKRRSDSAGYKGYIKKPTHYEDTDRTTFGGAMRYLYGVLHDMFPDAFIFFVTPCGLTYMSGGEHRYLEKGEQIKYAASLLGVPVVDWGVNGRLSVCDNNVTGTGTESDPYIYDAAGEYSLDALHPNNAGAKFLAMEVAKVLKGYDLVDYNG